MKLRRNLSAFMLCTIVALPEAMGAGTATPDDGVAAAEHHWRQSPHGAMLERILPPAIEPRGLPEPRSEGARLAVSYCVQCHYLPNPAMHVAARWKSVVERMVWRMQGRGNMGNVMQDMMADVRAPNADEQDKLTRYLQKHAQREIDPARFPDLKSQQGQMFSIACSQCHALPDPRQHTAAEWPQVVERMQRNMAWANRVVGDAALRTSPELDTAQIVRFLQRNSRAR